MEDSLVEARFPCTAQEFSRYSLLEYRCCVSLCNYLHVIMENVKEEHLLYCYFTVTAFLPKVNRPGNLITGQLFIF